MGCGSFHNYIRLVHKYLNYLTALAFIKNISTTATDAELVVQYKAGGDLDVLADLYQRYMDLIYGVCLKYTKDTEDAKDCVLNIFEELVLKLKKYEVDNFKGWLYQVAKNHCLMKLRSTKNLPKHIDADLVHLEENVHLNDILEKEANFDVMDYCMGKLIGEQRQTIELFYLKEKCYKDIAEITGLDANKVRSFIQNGRRNLKICMDKKMAENA